MSRIGRLPIEVPSGVEIELGEGNHLRVRGPRGELARDLHRDMRIEVDGGTIRVTRPNDQPKNRALHGLTRTLISNMVVGVATGFTKSLEIQGVGYRVQQQGEALAFQVGLSHPVSVEPPEGISFVVEGNRIDVMGYDKQLVGQVAANVRKIRPPATYTGKGIRYQGERVRRKAGKAGKGAAR